MIKKNFSQQYWNANAILILLLFTVLCYWPLAFGVFSAKNDNIVQFLPVRFHVSEALRNGHLPLWSPYMYLGYPIHGDMQGGAWNPVVWLLSLFGRYTLTSLHAEILIYVFFSGLGMYRLLGALRLANSSRIAGAAAYMMCGFITDVGGSNIPFLAAAPWLPFATAYFYQLLQQPSISLAIKSAVALSLLLVTAYPSFFILTCYILFAGFITQMVKNLRTKNYPYLKQMATYLACFVLLFLGLSAVAGFGYGTILPFFQRGSGVNRINAMDNSFHISCSLSLLLPSLPVKNGASVVTDLISRNAYFNSFLLVFCLSYWWSKKTLLLNFTLAGIIIFFLFSLGYQTPLRNWFYQVLPLMDTFRHPSNARLFMIMGSIVLGTAVYQQYLSGKLPAKYPLAISLAFIAGLTIAIILYIPGLSQGAQIKTILQHKDSLRVALKNFFDQLNFSDLLLLNGIIQIIFLGVFAWFLYKKKANRSLTILVIANSFVFAQLAIPYTLASKTSPSTINSLLKNYPEGYPVPDPKSSIDTNSVDALDHFQELGITGFYNKKISTTDVDFTPTFMSLIGQVYSDSVQRKIVGSNAYAYFANNVILSYHNQPLIHTAIVTDSNVVSLHSSTGASFQLEHFWNNGFSFETVTSDSSLFCLQQLYLPSWQAAIDGKKTGIHRVNTAFMGVVVPKGKHKLSFVYQPRPVLAGLIISVMSFLLVIFLLFKKRNERNQ
jgi:hypothetical protein